MPVLSCDDLAAELTRADVPVLLLDTCTILDVVRAPIREQLGIHNIDAVHTLIGRAAAAPPAVSFVITEQVLQEFREHVDAVETKTRDALKKAADGLASILTRMQALSPDDCIPGAVDLLSLGFPKKGRHLAEHIVQASFVLNDDHGEVIKKAWDRVRLAKPPATKAEQSMKDCLIVESCLRLAAILRSGGFSRNMVFATSNTKDYQQDCRSLHPVLREDFASTCLEYSSNWSAARHELDRLRTCSGLRTSGSGREIIAVSGSEYLRL